MVVVDASIVYKWYAQQEEYFEEALNLFSAHLSKTEILSAPELLLYELANAWATKTNLTVRRIELNLESLQKADIQLVSFSFKQVEKAIEFSKKYKVSVYDASYAILAEEKKCNFYTADSRFAERVSLSYVKRLSAYSL